MRQSIDWGRACVAMLCLALALTLQTSPAHAAKAPAANKAAKKAADTTGDPLFGSTVYTSGGESYSSALSRVNSSYGGVESIRMFFPGLPQPWSKIEAKVGDTPLVVSFKADPAAVVAGKYDAQLRKWFADAPTGRRTFWTYWHEPENDKVSTSAYRAAWQHLDNLADSVGNSKLRSTLILMCWTLNPKSGRDWRDYYPGSAYINVLGFDCYNVGRKKGVYTPPANILRPVVQVAQETGKSWGIAEFGSTVIAADGGEQGRAAWLRAFGAEVRKQGGEFATYFDSFVGFDYRLHDAASRTAWREVVQGP